MQPGAEVGLGTGHKGTGRFSCSTLDGLISARSAHSFDAFSRLMCAVTKMIVRCRARARDIGRMLPLIGHGD